MASAATDEGYHGLLADVAQPPPHQEQPQKAVASAVGADGTVVLRGGSSSSSAATGAFASAGAVWRPPVPVSDTPRIYVVDGFATAAECAEIFAAFEPGLEESHTMNADGSRQGDAKGRKSRRLE